MQTIDLQDLLADKAKIKYATAKQAIALSEADPKSLYPNFDFFLQFLDGKNQILKWTAIKVIGNLSKVDRKKKVDALLDKLIGLLNGGKLVTAANTVYALAKIAQHKPEYKDKILKALTKVEKYEYNTPECRNVVIGHVLKELTEFKDDIQQSKSLQNFIKRQTNNPRPKVKKLASELLT